MNIEFEKWSDTLWFARADGDPVGTCVITPDGPLFSKLAHPAFRRLSKKERELMMAEATRYVVLAQLTARLKS